MSDEALYSPRQQFRRALASDWFLYGMDLVYGLVYVLLGFFLMRRVGYSQVYNVIVPFLCASAYMIYQTWHICAPSARHATASYFFNLPQDRIIALYARLTFLGLGTVWLIGLVFVGSALKLGGAGITACYRVHPEFVALPFLAVAATVWHVHSVRGWGHWGRAAGLFLLTSCWIAWKLYAINATPPQASNSFWPQREMSLGTQVCVSFVMLGWAGWLLAQAHGQWRKRQIGAIQ